MLKFIKPAFLIILFAWISFLAPVMGGVWQTQATAFLFISLLILCILNKNCLKLIFAREEIPFWIFFITSFGGLINFVDRQVALQHFWSFIFPVPFIYFFAKTVFDEDFQIPLLRSVSLFSLIVCFLGVAEFLLKRNILYTVFFENLYYNVFIGRRMMSLHIHPIPLGTYFIAILPLVCVLFAKEKKELLRKITILSIALIVISTILTFSRAANMYLFTILIAMIFLSLRNNKKITLFIFMFLIGVMVFLSISLSRIDFTNRGRFSTEGFSTKIDFYLERVYMTKLILRDHPLFGVGFGQYRLLFDHYLPHLADYHGEDMKIPDNMYLTVVAESGLVGLAGFSFFIFSVFRKIRRKLKKINFERNNLILFGFVAGFIGIICAFITYDGLYWFAPNFLFWSYAGILSYLTIDNHRDKCL